jgi:hypothetical protein
MDFVNGTKGRAMASNRLVWAGMAGTLVWLAEQPTVDGYHPLLEMFWNPGLCSIPSWDGFVLLFSWLVTTLFCHFAFFTIQKVRQRTEPCSDTGTKAPTQQGS